MRELLEYQAQMLAERRNGSLEPWWIVGFTDADGSFSVCIYLSEKTGYRRFTRVRAFFDISQKEDTVLQKVRSFFGFGIITNKTERYRHYVVNKQSDILKVRDFFCRYPLQTDKEDDFEKWSKIVDLMQKGEHLNDDGILKIAEIRQSMNLRGKKRRNFQTIEEIRGWLRKHPN